jgi:hypothetical protein
MQALYSGEIISLLTLVAAKGSLLVPFMTVTPVVKHRRMMHLACPVTVLWGLSGVLMIAFQYPPPERWDITNPSCMDIVSSVHSSHDFYEYSLNVACYSDIQRRDEYRR